MFHTEPTFSIDTTITMAFLWRILIFVIFAAAILIAVLIGIQFGKVAQSKGYNKTPWTIAAIFLGLPIWLLIIALPNKVQHQEILAALRELKDNNT